MGDRELLELAAKAAGLKTHTFCESWNGMAAYTLQDGWHGPTWNPLTDDGDALRLAVKLGMLVEPGRARVGDVDARCSSMQRPVESATRRAIVRAAAALASSATGER